MTVVKRVHTNQDGPLQALNAVLQSIESVRNVRALYLLLLTFAIAGLLVSMAQRALGDASALPAIAWAAAAFFSVFYGSSAAGLVVLDEARGDEPRLPAQALRDAMRRGHRLLLVVLAVLLAALLPLALVLVLLQAATLPGVGRWAMGAAVAVGVPGLGLVGLVMVMLVGPIAAPAVWSGLGVRDTLAMIARQVRRRLAHAVLLSAAVSLLTAAVAGLVSFVVLLGGQLVLALGVSVAGLPLSPQPVMAALFGTGFRLAPGAQALSSLTGSAITAAGLVFALGLVVPGAVYLRGLCELFLALRRLDADDDAPATLPTALLPTAGT
jgi:hypothetical protein